MSVTVRSEIVDLDGLIPGAVDNDRITNALKACETISLPMRNWKQPEREYSRSSIRTQGLMLNMLMHTIYNNLDGIQGAAMVKLQEGLVPIISYTGWFEGQTWSQFLMETLSIMLGQLAKTMSIRTGNTGVQDQNIFVVGYYGRYIHVARGLFPADTIARVHSQGCSKDEAFDLKFTRSYDLCSKKDWLEATRALTRLYRYLLSGNTKANAVQAYLQRTTNTGNDVP
ncbi:hypothetical protein BDV34DRAFT_233660 [Aspergillus parasiticus]|uniref:Uncharacterized protein n=1 Tax=Aspergillus parasiticus TaxID=5067 RepID=A0A5N6DSG6_ASPPA|nr:hypothetical protein BDV34DRAFT_233660 [Aspergillus parasiticus]